VLICLQREPYALMREVALKVGITERAVQRIVADLERGGFLVRHKEGRRNRYSLSLDVHLRHPIEAHRKVGEMLELLAPVG
jgi:DNA-binding transcriptional regulator PaaX